MLPPVVVWTLAGGADAAAAESMEMTCTSGATQRVPTASPAPFKVARRESDTAPLVFLDIPVNPSTVNVNRSRAADDVTVCRKGMTPEGIRGRVGEDHPM